MQGTGRAPPFELQRRRGAAHELRDRGTKLSTGAPSSGDKGRRYMVLWPASMGGEGAQVEELGAGLDGWSRTYSISSSPVKNGTIKAEFRPLHPGFMVPKVECP
jgi:hypothetical protein